MGRILGQSTHFYGHTNSRGQTRHYQRGAFSGRKIEAIKIHRESTGLGLAQSKAAVEELEKELRATAPEKFAPSIERRGCLGVLLVFCTLTAMVALWMVVKP